MDGRVDFTPLDRTRILESLSAGSLGQLGHAPYTGSEQTHSSALSRLGAASAAAAAAAGVTSQELSRADSPTSLQQYPGRFLPSSGIPPPGASYAMMAGYLANSGHVPDSLKHLLPEVQQYWASASHTEGYARYLLNNMYYPYLPYLPATESLSMFAHNSTSTAQVQAALQAQAAHHRIYDLQKEALFGAGVLPPSLYGPSQLFSNSQMEATNLSLPGSSRTKPSERQRDGDSKDGETRKDHDKCRDTDGRKDHSKSRDSDSRKEGDRHRHSSSGDRHRDSSSGDKHRDSSSGDKHRDGSSERKRMHDTEINPLTDNAKAKSRHSEGSERTRGVSSKTDDRSKIKSSSKIDSSTKPERYPGVQYASPANTGPKFEQATKVFKPQTVSASEMKSLSDSKLNPDTVGVTGMSGDQRSPGDMCSVPSEKLIHKLDSNRPTAFHSPTRKERVVSPERRSSKTSSPVGKKSVISPINLRCDNSITVQDMPENLCVKDRQRDKDVPQALPNVTSVSPVAVVSCPVSVVSAGCVRTQAVVTGTTVTVTGTLNVITTDSMPDSKKMGGKSGKDISSPQVSPRETSGSTTSTTYSLPYYHSLYSRSQPVSQQGKKVHAVTYVPEIGTVTSPIAGAPSIIDVVDTHKLEADIKPGESSSVDNETKPDLSLSPNSSHNDTRKEEEGENVTEQAEQDNVKSVGADMDTLIPTKDKKCDTSKGGRRNKGDKKKSEKILGQNVKTDKDSAHSKDDTEPSNINECVQKQTKRKLTVAKSDKNSSMSTVQKKRISQKQIAEDKKTPEESASSGDKDDDNNDDAVITDSKLNHSTECKNDTEDGTENRKGKDKLQSKKMPNRAVKSTSNNKVKKIDPAVCDMNHNSKQKSDLDKPAGQDKLEDGKSDIDKPADQDKTDDASKASPSVADVSESIPVTKDKVEDETTSQKEKDGDKNVSDKTEEQLIPKPKVFAGKQITNVRSVFPSRNKPDSQVSGATDGSKRLTSGHAMKTSSISVVKPTLSKSSDGQTTNTAPSIPVGIAVARQRNIAPKITSDKDNKKAAEEAKSKHPTADIKPVRPLKIIRPSTKGTTPGSDKSRNDLPANLIVTGGSPAPGGVFWPDDSASRQLAAAQFLQSGHSLVPTTWYGQTQFALPPTVTTPTTDTGSQGNQLPLTVPPGCKLAQDSLTGQILLIPAGAEMYDTSRVFSGFPIGTHVPQGSAFGSSILPSQQVPASLSATSSLFTGQQAVTDRPSNLEFTIPQQFPQIYNASVLPATPEVAIKGDKGASSVQQTTSAVITPSVILPNAPDSAPATAAAADKNKQLLNIPQPAIVTDINIQSSQQCSYNFPSPSVPFVYNPSLLTPQNVVEHAPEVNHLKHELTSVQSRGTSPMLPAIDSCNEENEECSHLPAVTKQTDEVCTLKADNGNTKVDKEETNDNIRLKTDERYTSIDTDPMTCSTAKLKDIRNIDAKVEESVKLSTIDLTENTKVILESKQSATVKSGNEKCDCSTDSTSDARKGESVKVESSLNNAHKADRNIFTELTEYNPFTDPQILQAADGLELLSALAEKSSLCSQMGSSGGDSAEKSAQDAKDAIKDDIYTFKDDTIRSSGEKQKHKKSKPRVKLIEKQNTAEMEDDELKSTNDSKSKHEKQKPRIKCGSAYKAKKTEEPVLSVQQKTMTFCGITIPEDDDVIDSIEAEMKMRLAELQRRYKEKQRELTKLMPKRDRDSDKEKDADKAKPSNDKSSAPDTKRGPGRPKKRKHASGESPDSAGEPTTSRSKPQKKDLQGHNNSPPSGSHGNAGGNHGQHGSTKKKKLAEMLVDRVFRKTGSSFKMPLSKKISLIAPARMELPGGTTAVEKTESVRPGKSLDFRKLIKRSRLSQLNGKDKDFMGGHWQRKEDKKKTSLFYSSKLKIKKKEKKKEKGVDVENGLGLLAEYATKTQEARQAEHATTSAREESQAEEEKKKRKSDEATSTSSPESPNKKRKPGRPKKCDVIRPGVTETIVAKQSKHMDFFRWQQESRIDEPKPERKISLDGKTPLKPLYLDEWNVRRSERIFLSDPSPQTSPSTAVSPGPKSALSPRPKSTSSIIKPKCSTAVSQQESHGSDTSDEMKTERRPSGELVKKSRAMNVSQKVKRKYSASYQQQKARDKTTELLKASRDRLTQKRQERKKLLSSTSATATATDPATAAKMSESDTDDVPLSQIKNKSKAPGPETCVIRPDDLCDGMRILVFMDGLFHEGEMKAIRPPDIYGAVLENERRTRPHYFSQEEILKEAIKDVRPTSESELWEGRRICAYWSQQFSCLYPGSIAKGSPNPDPDKTFINVEFDDGDTGKIPLDHIRIIPQDFPLVEYDPNPLLLLTKRRRTVSISEGSEPKKSQTELTPQKEGKVKKGPGRPPKVDRLVSSESMGDEDVFEDGEQQESKTGDKKKRSKKRDQEADLTVAREMWTWSGSSTKRPGLKGKAKKEYYKTIIRDRETISVGECAVFLSTGRPNLPYVGRIESFWEAWGGQMAVKVKWFYHPEETKGGKRLQNMKGALFRSDHEDENDVQTISHKCDVISYSQYMRRKGVISLDDSDDVYYLAGSYQPTIGHIKFEPGVL